MKKLLALLLVLMMMFSMFACGEKAKPNDDSDGKTDNDSAGDVVEADPLFLKNIEAAAKKMGDAKAFDMSAMMTLDAAASGITINLPIKMALQYKYTGDIPEKFETLDQLETMGLFLKMSVEATIPGVFSPEEASVKAELYFADGIFYINANDEKVKFSIDEAMLEEDDEQPQISGEQIVAFMQAVLKGVKAPSSDIVSVSKSDVDGGTNLSYTVKGTALYDYVKSALQIICTNIDSEEVRAMAEALEGDTSEDESLYSQVYDFDNIDWVEFFRNEMDSTVDEVKDMYIDVDAERESWTDAEWETFFHEQFDPDFYINNSGEELYDTLYGDEFTFTFKDTVVSVFLKNDMIASMSASFGLALTMSGDADYEVSQVDLSASASLTYNAIGEAVSILAPDDLDEYISYFEELDSSIDLDDEISVL